VGAKGKIYWKIKSRTIGFFWEIAFFVWVKYKKTSTKGNHKGVQPTRDVLNSSGKCDHLRVPPISSVAIHV
jgi:hypothetical protein